MATVKFTKALRRFFPSLEEYHSYGLTLPEVIQDINGKHPGILNYILDEQGRLRKHVNIFVNGDMINDRETLSDAITMDSEVFIIQALSGG